MTNDNDLIRRGDAILQATRWVRGFVEADTVGKAIAALPAVAPAVTVKPLVWEERAITYTADRVPTWTF